VTDAYCDLLLRWARVHDVAAIFYDRSSIPQNVKYSAAQLRGLLGSEARRSHLLVSFLSPEYIGSKWCRFEYETKWTAAPRQIHKVYWKPQIETPLFPRLATLHSPIRMRFLRTVLDWDHIRHGEKLEEWGLDDAADKPANFSDVTDVYRRGFWAGPGPVVRCAQRSATILCREHPTLFGGEPPDPSFFKV
jgi:hypothetical protein